MMMFVVSLRGRNCSFWSHLGCSGPIEVLVRVEGKETKLRWRPQHWLSSLEFKDIIALTCSFLFLYYQNKAWATPRLVSFSEFQFLLSDDYPCALNMGRSRTPGRFLYRVVYSGWLKGSSRQLTRTYERYAMLGFPSSQQWRMKQKLPTERPVTQSESA